MTGCQPRRASAGLGARPWPETSLQARQATGDRLQRAVQQAAGLVEVGLAEFGADAVGPGALDMLDGPEAGDAVWGDAQQAGAPVPRVVLVAGGTAVHEQ